MNEHGERMLRALVDGPRTIDELATAAACCQRKTRAMIQGCRSDDLVDVVPNSVPLQIRITPAGLALIATSP